MEKVYVTDFINNRPSCRHIVFFALGNSEVQRRLRELGYSNTDINKLINYGFKMAALLSDFIVQPTAHYCEPKTRQIMLQFLKIFKSDYGAFVLGDDVEDYEHDLELKAEQYPSRTDIYSSKESVKLISRELTTLGPKLYRKGGVGFLIGQEWEAAFDESDLSQFNYFISLIRASEGLKQSQKKELIHFLFSLPNNRGTRAFDWEFVYESLQEVGFTIPDKILLEIRKFLLHRYLLINAKLYSAAIVFSSKDEKFFYPEGLRINRYNATLFLNFAKIMGIDQIIINLSANEILEIKKYFESFNQFREKYFEIIDRAKEVESETLIRLKAEVGEQEEIQNKRIVNNIYNSSQPLLLKSAIEIGVCEKPEVLYFPKDDKIYYFKKTLLKMDDIPFIRFRDELIHKFSQKLTKWAEDEILKNKKIFIILSFQSRSCYLSIR